MDKLDNEGNNEEYFPPKFQNNTYFNFATNIGQKLPLVLTDLLSSSLVIQSMLQHRPNWIDGF